MTPKPILSLLSSNNQYPLKHAKTVILNEAKTVILNEAQRSEESHFVIPHSLPVPTSFRGIRYSIFNRLFPFAFLRNVIARSEATWQSPLGHSERNEVKRRISIVPPCHSRESGNP